MKLIDTDKIPYIEYINGSVSVEKADIDKMPTVDAELVIRCKDCQHSPAADDNCPLPAQYIVPDGYCHLGKVKNE